MKRKIGDRVTWRSQAGGNWKTKSGRVVGIVPVGNVPAFSFIADATLHDGVKMFDGGRRFDGESYLVAVEVEGANDKKREARIYWPLNSALRSEE